MEKYKFWMLHAESGESPQNKYKDIDSARKDAENLAKELGCRVYILEGVEEVALMQIAHRILNYHNPLLK